MKCVIRHTRGQIDSRFLNMLTHALNITGAQALNIIGAQAA